MGNAQQIDKDSKAALDLMSEHGIAASPENYAVFFSYCGSAAPTVAHALDQALKDKGGLQEGQVQEIERRLPLLAMRTSTRR